MLHGLLNRAAAPVPSATAGRSCASRQGRNGTRYGVKLPDRLVAAVGNPEQVAGKNDPSWVIRARDRRSPVTAAGRSRASCQSRHCARCGIKLPDRMVEAVGDVEVGTVGSDAHRVVEPCGRPCPA